METATMAERMARAIMKARGHNGYINRSAMEAGWTAQPAYRFPRDMTAGKGA